MNRISHWIDGRIVESTSGRDAAVFNPATGEQTGAVDLASVGEVDAAIAAAKAAFPAVAVDVAVEACRDHVPDA